jgi:regulator of sigma E protease
MQDLFHLFASVPGGEVAWKIMMFIVVLSVLVFVHEWGHYMAARSVGIAVDVFSIGFGREIWGFNDKNGTRWKVSLIPLGGYVRMVGDTPDAEANLSAEQRKGSFFSKNVYARMWVVAAGPLVNFIFAAIILAGLMMYGEQRILPVLGEIVEKSAAAEGGLRTGDRIVSMAGKPVGDWVEMAAIIEANGGKTIPVTVQRDGQTLTLSVTPELIETRNVFGESKTIGILGVRSAQPPETILVRHGVMQALWMGVVKTYDYTAMTLKAIGRMITGAMPAEIGGPLSIGDMAGDSAKYGFYSLCLFAAIISINLGLINLFPVPMLDGGHLVFFSIEAIMGKPVHERIQDIGYRIGFTLVVMLMVFATWKDINKFFLSRDVAPPQAVEAVKE